MLELGALPFDVSERLAAFKFDTASSKISLAGRNVPAEPSA